MSLFIGRGLRQWPRDAGFPAQRWICTAPVHRRTIYPVIVDLIEALIALDGDAAGALDGVVSPQWAFFGCHAAESTNRAIHYREIWVAESDAEERFLIDSVCRLIAGLGGCGVILRDPHRYDPMSIRLARRLIREAQARRFPVGLDAPVASLRNSVFADLLDSSIVVEGLAQSDENSAGYAIFDHSVPATVFCAVVGAQSDHRWRAVEGPGGVEYVSDPEVLCGDVSSMRSRLLAAWSPDGWSYLRRGMMLSESNDPNSFHAQHAAYTFGMSLLSRDFLFQYLQRALANPALWNRMPADDLHARMSAARLATRVATNSGFAQAQSLYLSCLEYDLDAVERVEIFFELANCLAVQKKSTALAQARRWYRQGFKALSRIDDAEKRLRWRVQLLNGLALVEYHSRHDRQALRLELRARLAANANPNRFAYVAAWANRLLNLNTAKLLSVRLGETKHARKMLQKNVCESQEFDTERAHAQLAALLYDQGDYSGVLGILEPLIRDRGWRSFDLTEEFFCRWIYILALRAVGRMGEYASELTRLMGTCERRDAVKALTLVDRLRKLDERPQPVSLTDNR